MTFMTAQMELKRPEKSGSETQKTQTLKNSQLKMD